MPSPSPSYEPTPSPTDVPSPSQSYEPTPSPTYVPSPSPRYEPTPTPSPSCAMPPTPSPTPSPSPSPSDGPDVTSNEEGQAREPSWRVLESPPPGEFHDGLTEIATGGNFGVGRYAVTRQLKCNPILIEYHATLSTFDAKITVEFVDGWIFKHSAIPLSRLLIHEKLHWSIAVYVAQKFDAIAKDVVTDGIGSTEQEAKYNAREWANMRLNAIDSLHYSFLSRIQSRYDTETNGGEIPLTDAFDQQLDWEATWQRKIDIDFEIYKQDHLELQPFPI